MWFNLGKNKKKDRGMRSAVAQHKIEGVKRTNLGHIPMFLQFFHKGLEKSVPDGTKDGVTGGQTFQVSKDLMALTIHKPELLEAIDKVELVYAK